MTKILALIIFLNMVGAGVWAADRTVKGYVLDKEGTPLPGAVVYDDGNHKAVADGDGYFELTVPDDVRQLKAGYVGFATLTHPMERPDDVQVLVLSPATSSRRWLSRQAGWATSGAAAA